MSKHPVRSCWLTALQYMLAILLTFSSGCSSSNDNNSSSSDEGDNPGRPTPINVVVVDDAALAETIERRWKAASDGEIHIENVQETDASAAKSKTAGADVLIYPSPWLGELAESRQLIPVSSRVLNDSQYDRLDIMPLDRTSAVTWGEKVYAFSFGVPQLVLMYRKDVFEQLKLASPNTWKEYQQTLDRLSAVSAESGAGQVAIEPLAAGWASQMLLARAAAYARQRNRYWTLFNYETMEPMINGPPFRRALSELTVAAGKRSGAATHTPETARQELLAGRCLMAITWPCGRDKVTADNNVEVAFAPLPGCHQIYNLGSKQWDDLRNDDVARVSFFGFDGRLGSVLTSSAHPHDAFNFLAWLTGNKRSESICTKSTHTAPFRQSHKKKASLWVGEARTTESAEQYFATVASSKGEPLRLAALPIPGRDEYLAALDQAVQESLQGTNPAAALDAAAAKWRQVTKRLGSEKQKTAYKRSLGIEP